MVDAADHHRPGPGVTLVNTSDRHGHRANGSGGQSGRQTEGNYLFYFVVVVVVVKLF
jgi:hypothetical protein